MIQDYTVEQLVEKYNVPEIIAQSIKDYVEGRLPVGSFLQAVICNNLFDAINRADDESASCLQGIVRIFYNQTPTACWGSVKRYNDWLIGFNSEDHFDKYV